MQCFDLKQYRASLWQALQNAACDTPFSIEAFQRTYAELVAIDRFWTYPGRGVLYQIGNYLQTMQYALVQQLVSNANQALQSEHYRQQPFRPFHTNLELLDRPVLREVRQLDSAPIQPRRPYAEVLIVHPFPDDYEMFYRQQLAALKSTQDEFVYDIVLVNCAEDAITAVLANTDIQACVYLNHVEASTVASSALFATHAVALLATTPPLYWQSSVEVNLCRTLRALRPELNHYLISEQAATDMPMVVRAHFDRVMFHMHPFQELHVAILNGLRQRFATPFFDALQTYSRQPKGVFHALPLSRGASVKGSPWVHDMLDFYGDNIFLAETSSTQGGLDSLLDPTGAIKQAHNKAAETFGADASYFVTNGTSTSNKIIFQANVRPGDIVLISADCHKSIPYAVMLAGAYPIFLEAYPLVEHDLYGAIALAQIKAVMLDLRAHGRLHLLKQITLTNSTFDGLIYHCENFMMEILAIKPDLIFHWDEAWFAFAHFHPLYHSRSAMTAVSKIRQRLHNVQYREFYTQWAAEFEANTDPDKWQKTIYPDPLQVRLRVYATQSTHKTLTAFRQASMIHVADDVFDATGFLEAFRIHTSTSPNYQIIASLDIARRQAALEGFYKVRETIWLSLQLRQRIQTSTALAPYFSVLDDATMVPDSYRREAVTESASALSRLSASWGTSDFVVDPTRITLNISRTGLDGSSFRQLLMTRYDIQVNKTSRHTVLFLINIGATQATVDYLFQVLQEMADHFQHGHRRLQAIPAAIPASLALPEKRIFHAAFQPFAQDNFHACDIRRAYFDGTRDALVTFVPLSSETRTQLLAGRIWVSASFVTPYPPGFPVIVPGQVITIEILDFFRHIKVKEIHGFSAERGFKVFTDEHLNSHFRLNST